MTNSAANVKKGLFITKGRRDSIDAYLFIAPFMIGIILFQLYIFISGFYLAMTNASGINIPKFIGFQNFLFLWKDLTSGGEFSRSATITFEFEIGCLITQIPVAFVLAFILNSIPYKRIRTGLRTALFIPCLINSIIAGWLFNQIFNPDQGFLNYFMGLLGLLKRNPDTHMLIPIQWMQNKSLAIPILVIVTFWQWTGYHMVYFLSQLQVIDRNLYEAARIDGARPYQILTRITLPLMRPAFAFVLVTQMVGGLLIFDIIFTVFLVGLGTFGPGDSAKTFMLYIYYNAFAASPPKLGLASAAGWFVFLIIFIINIIQMRIIGLGTSRGEE